MPELKNCPACFSPSTPIVVLDAQHKPGGLKCRHCGARFATPDAVRVAQSLLRRKDDHPTAPAELEAGKAARHALERELTRVRNDIWYDYRNSDPFYRANVAACWRETCREFERAVGLALGGHGDEQLRKALQAYATALGPAPRPVAQVEHSRTPDGTPIVTVSVHPAVTVNPTPVTVQNHVHVPASKSKKVTLHTPKGTITGTSEDA